MIVLFIPLAQQDDRQHHHRPWSLPQWYPDQHRANPDPTSQSDPPHERGCADGSPTQRQGRTPSFPPYLHTAEVADILHVSPKTVARWAKEGKLPFLKTLGGHRRYPAAEIRQLADQLQVRPTV